MNTSSRNSRKGGKLEHINTDPMALQHDSQISRNKYTNRISTDNYSNQKYTYDTGMSSKEK